MDDDKTINQSHISKSNGTIATKKLYNTGTSFAGLGLVLMVLGHLFKSLPGYISPMGIGMLFFGIPLFFFGCYRMAKGKGYHGAWALLGFLSLIGLIILFLLPTRVKSK